MKKLLAKMANVDLRDVVPYPKMLRRLLCIPAYMLFRVLLTTVAVLGWGANAGKRLWRDTQ